MFKYHDYKIIKVHKGYHIKKYWIIVNNKKENIIEELWLGECLHPNAWGGEDGEIDLDNPPLKSKFCLPQYIIGSKLISNSLFSSYLHQEKPFPKYLTRTSDQIKSMLSEWCLDDPHHFPPKYYVTTIPPLPKEIR